MSPHGRAEGPNPLLWLRMGRTQDVTQSPASLRSVGAGPGVFHSFPPGQLVLPGSSGPRSRLGRSVWNVLEEELFRLFCLHCF